MRLLLLSALVCPLLAFGQKLENTVSDQASLLKPGAAIDARNIVFEPKLWEDHQLKPTLTPWTGRNIIFLTTDADLDAGMITHFVSCLDKGWDTYAELTGRKPKLFKQWNGMPTVVAVPAGDLTCGAGCGYIGVSGVELSLFYDRDVAVMKRNPRSFPHYGFYELGRNFYTFGDRHSCFITGFAVFMRYVCMDAAGCEDDELKNRRHIEAAEQTYAKSQEPFLSTFTNNDGPSEKENRLKDSSGKPIPITDQPVMYATAMLKLRRDFGGDEWVKRFFTALARCPEFPGKTKDAASNQCLVWLVCASSAAKQDMTPVFCDRWRMQIDPALREKMHTESWSDPAHDFTQLLK
jgi:hypothetical protein